MNAAVQHMTRLDNELKQLSFDGSKSARRRGRDAAAGTSGTQRGTDGVQTKDEAQAAKPRAEEPSDSALTGQVAVLEDDLDSLLAELDEVIPVYTYVYTHVFTRDRIQACTQVCTHFHAHKFAGSFF